MKGDELRPRHRALGRLAVAALALAAALWISPGRAVELGGFFEHTLYTQEGEPVADYKPRVLLLLHGFKSAMPNNDYGIIHEAFGEAYTVAGYNYDYTEVAANTSDMDELLGEVLKDRRIIVIGTSLGGFWADHLARRFPVDGAILVNPSIKPEETMRRNLGKQHSKKRMSDFTVTEAAAEAYGRLERPERDGIRRLVLVSKDDQILDYRETTEAFAGAKGTSIVAFDEGGHNLPLERPDVMAEIRGFIEETWKD